MTDEIAKGCSVCEADPRGEFLRGAKKWIPCSECTRVREIVRRAREEGARELRCAATPCIHCGERLVCTVDPCEYHPDGAETPEGWVCSDECWDAHAALRAEEPQP